MPTTPITYRVSPEVDAELKRLAAIHGGADKALRVLFGWALPLVSSDLKPTAVEDIAASLNNRTFKPPLLRPREKK